MRDGKLFSLETHNGAVIDARYDVNAFKVTCDDFYFDALACDEASKFFNKLVKKLRLEKAKASE